MSICISLSHRPVIKDLQKIISTDESWTFILTTYGSDIGTEIRKPEPTPKLPRDVRKVLLCCWWESRHALLRTFAKQHHNNATD